MSYRGRTILAIGAHPDDLEVAMGGTLARFAAEGVGVVMAVLSVPNQYEARRREAVLGAQILGCELRILLDGGPRRVEDLRHGELVELLARQLSELDPAAVFTHSAHEVHFDHVALHDACVALLGPGPRDFFTFNPTVARQRSAPEVRPRAFADITGKVEQKMRAIEAHASQFGDRGVDLGKFREHARMTGRLAGVEYAEAFDVGRLRLA